MLCHPKQVKDTPHKLPSLHLLPAKPSYKPQQRHKGYVARTYSKERKQRTEVQLNTRCIKLNSLSRIHNLSHNHNNYTSDSHQQRQATHTHTLTTLPMIQRTSLSHLPALQCHHDFPIADSHEEACQVGVALRGHTVPA